MKGHWSRVNLVKRFALLKDLHATSVLSFPNAKKKLCTSILLIMLKPQITPKKSKKSMSIFGHMTGVFHWEIFATVSYASSHKCHGSVNILLK